MSYLVIDTTTAATSTYFDQLTQLDGVQYLLNFWWSDRESAWYLGIYDQDENPLALGVRLNVSWLLLRRFTNTALPPGALFCLDTSGTDTDIAVPSDLGQRVLFMYVTADDVAVVQAAP